MASDAFNSLGGYTIGIPPFTVVDASGNITANKANIGNLTASIVTSTGNITAPYFIGNVVGNISGNLVVPGTNTSILFNNQGNAGASNAFQFNNTSNVVTLTGNIAVTNILTNNYLYANGSPFTFQATAAGSNNQLQFNSNGLLNASANLTFNSSTNTLGIVNISAVDASITTIETDGIVVNGNVSADYFTGNLIGNVSNANIISANLLTGTLTTNAQPNITSVGTLTTLNVAGNIIPGANNQYDLGTTANRWRDLYLSGNTIYLGNASIEANATAIIFTNPGGSNFVLGGNDLTITGNITAGGNLSIANISAGNLVSANFLTGTLTTANQPNITNVGTLSNLTVSGNINAANVIAVTRVSATQLSGLVVTASQPNITSVGTLNGLTVSGNISGANWIISNYLSGNGAPITYITGANVVGAVANATYSLNAGNATIANLANVATLANSATLANTANVAGTVTTNAQPNITSVGTLTSLTVAGNVTAANFIGNIVGNITTANFASYAGNVTVAGQSNITSVGTLTVLNVSGNITAPNITANTGIFTGNGSGLTQLTGANVTGTVANATYALTSGSSNTAGTVTTNAQPNITSVGTLTSLSVTGNVSAGNVSGTLLTGTLATAAQPNVTSLGTLTGLTSSGNITAPYFIGNLTGNIANANYAAYAGNVTASSQPNITSVGTLVSLSVTGNITAGNVTGANLISANFLTGTLTTQTQSNIHTVGTLGFLDVDTSLPGANGNITFNGSMSGTGAQSDIDITGNLTAGNVSGTFVTGVITTNEQPNITLLGTLTELNVAGPANLGSISNLTITGGTANYVLSTDGAGNLSWVAQTGGGGGNGTPGGLNTYIQYNDNGNFAGSANLSWNNSTQMVTVGGNINVLGRANVITLISSVSTGTAPFTVTSTTPVANLAVDTASTVRTNAQPNITSVGTLTSLDVSGNISAGNLSLGGAFSVSGNFSAGNISTSGQTTTVGLTATGNTTLGNVFIGNTKTVNVSGTFNTNSSANVNLGEISNIHIYGGTNGQLLSTDGAGGLTWTTGGGGGGNGTPGGSNTQVQYNDTGVFGGSAYFTFNEVTNTLQIAGNLIANTSQMGAGIYKFSTQYVYFATTASTAPDQLLWSVPVANVSGVDFHIIATDVTGSTRQSSKISTMVYGSNVVWNEYGSLHINGGTGSFSVVYDAGSIITPATLQLIVTPDSSNSTTYKMMITEYAP
jgi:hypothetical protein